MLALIINNNAFNNIQVCSSCEFSLTSGNYVRIIYIYIYILCVCLPQASPYSELNILNVCFCWDCDHAEIFSVVLGLCIVVIF